MDNVVWPVAGRYVVALSGGSDSVALLDLMAEAAAERGYELHVAHFNHGWPGDDAYEEVACRQVERYGLAIEVGHGHTKRTEADARRARYAFLRQVVAETGAEAIVTAHHRDDLEETVILNLLRGTGRRGLTPFVRQPDVVRPLVGLRKAELRAYAQRRELEWCHDSYNDDLHFRRNQVRQVMLPQLRQHHPDFDARLEGLLRPAVELNRQIDTGLAAWVGDAGISLQRLRPLALEVIQELIVELANRARPGVELNARSVEALAVDIKTGRFRRGRPLTKQLSVVCQRGTLEVVFTP